LVDCVTPATFTLPLPSTSIETPSSNADPPTKVDHCRAPDGQNRLTNASVALL
jgi:hypothetical protein